MSISNVKKNFEPDTNWWSINPQMIIMSPYSELYQEDKSKDKSKSSKTMWTIFFLQDSDEDLNKFYRMEYKQRLKTVLETFNADFNLQDSTTKKCFDKYPEHCMTSVERSFKLEKDAFNDLCSDTVQMQREMKQEEIPLDLKLDLIKKLTGIRKDFPKLIESYEKMEQRFIKSKARKVKRGGGNLTKSEQGLLDEG